MGAMIRGEFKTRFNAVLKKQINRATAKTFAQKQIHDSNSLSGTVAVIAQAASTHADLRGWLTLTAIGLTGFGLAGA